MNFNEYQKLASRTAGIHENRAEALKNWCMGLTGETGEFVDYMKKVLFHGHELDIGKSREELGDILWYIAQIAKTLEISMQEIAEHNINKLKKRYPDGFSTEASINRRYEDV